MKKHIIPIIAIVFLILLTTSCELGPLPDGKAKGELEFDFDLSYPASKGFAIDKVKVTLTHQVTGKVVEEYLTVDPLNNHASGTISKLRVGWWDLLVELYELDIVVGSGEEEVEIRAGETTRVEIRMRLETGDVEIIVEWGEDEPYISVLPLTYDFGDITVGTLSSPLEVTIANKGTADLNVSDIYVSDITNFSLNVNSGSDPLGTTSPVIEAGGSGTVTVTFSPQSEGAFHGALLITSDDPDTSLVKVLLDGKGLPVPVPNISVFPTNYDFGDITEGNPSPSLEVTISNTGTAALYVSNIVLSDTVNFLLNLSGGLNPCVIPNPTIAVGGTGTFTVTFTPQSTGTFNGTVTITSDDPDTPSIDVSLTGNGTTIPVAISGETTAYSVAEMGNYIDLTFTADQGVQLVDANWVWTGQAVWLDVDGQNMVPPENNGVDDWTFHFYDPPTTDPPPSDAVLQIFGFYATGFDSGDYFKFTMDLDYNPTGEGGTPLTEDYIGGTMTLEFSDGTILTAVYDTPVDEPWGAKATFSTNP